MKKLKIDGTLVELVRIESVPGGFPNLVRVFVGKDGTPWSQHDIPSEGTFRTNGHHYSWVTS